MDRPPDYACGRVTDATRYQVVVQTAAQLIDELTASYQVELRQGGPELAPELCEGLQVDRVVKLEPSSEDAAHHRHHELLWGGRHQSRKVAHRAVPDLRL
jgi:hypothetical protein